MWAGLLGNCILDGCCRFSGGYPSEDVRSFASIVELASEYEFLFFQLIIGIESDDDRMIVKTRRSFVCRSRCRIPVRWPNASNVSLSLLS